jgi:hypothetical protein
MSELADGGFQNASLPPTMAGGVTDLVWDMTDVAALIAAHEAPVAKRRPYKKKAA